MKVEDMLRGHIDPRGNSFADPDVVDQRCDEIAVLLDQDKDEYQIAQELRGYVEDHLRSNTDLYIAVHDRLAERKIITKLHFKQYLAHVSQE